MDKLSRGFGVIGFEANSDRAFGRSENLGSDSFVPLRGTYSGSQVHLEAIDGSRIYRLTPVAGLAGRLAGLDETQRLRVVRLRGTVEFVSPSGEVTSTYTVACWANAGGTYGVSEAAPTPPTHQPF